MKIEICQSLIFSWLRHVQGCVVTQTSWKPSPTWGVARECELTQAFEAIRSFANQHIGVQIFKNGDFDQFIRQAEIDVLGVRGEQDAGGPGVIAVDSAFHEYGLQYGNADETIGRVLKKLIRAAFAIEAYLDVADASIVFATPKMAEAVRGDIQRHLATLELRLAEQRSSAIPRLRFRIIANADFSNNILAPVLEQRDAVADTSELFMRAQQLMRLPYRSAKSLLSCRNRSCGQGQLGGGSPHRRARADHHGGTGGVGSAKRPYSRQSPRSPLLQGEIQPGAAVPEASRPGGPAVAPTYRR